jgi:RNA polymerase sigma-70 factor (ECF subfamily)
MTQQVSQTDDEHRAIVTLLEHLRPKLHRYCARMAGSAVDGEDIVQDVLLKALETLPGTQIDNIENWLFRVAHNTSIDFLRRRQREMAMQSEGELDMIADRSSSAADRIVAAAALKSFMYLPVPHRACTILMDVLGYSQQEIVDITGMTIPAVKAALHRGRARIRQLADAPDQDVSPQLSHTELSRLANYVEHFNGRNFDVLREMLAEDVRLDLVAKTRLDGRGQVSRYFHNYSGLYDWHFVPGLVDRRPGLLVFDTNNPAPKPSYFVLLEWLGEQISFIRDFRNARYVAESAEMIPFGIPRGSS